MPYKFADISAGKTVYPISIVNELDDARFDKVTYIEGVINRNETLMRQGCACIGDCGIDPNCICVAQSGIKLINKGRIKNTGDLHEHFFRKKLFECCTQCKCRGNCSQKVSFDKLPHHLEIFRTKKAGFSVRTKEFIHKGTFICQLAGEMLTPYEVTKGHDLDNDFLYTFKSGLIEDIISLSIYCKTKGNISRYFNHSCFPNMFLLLFYTDQANPAWPNVGFVANRDIDEGEELTFFYGEQWISELMDAKKFCYCQADYCIRPAPGVEPIDYDIVVRDARFKAHQLKKKRKSLKATANIG